MNHRIETPTRSTDKESRSKQQQQWLKEYFLNFTGFGGEGIRHINMETFRRNIHNLFSTTVLLEDETFSSQVHQVLDDAYATLQVVEQRDPLEFERRSTVQSVEIAVKRIKERFPNLCGAQEESR